MNIKTNHAGAKNGGGFWGPRAEAKGLSTPKRRAEDKAAIAEGVEDLTPDQEKRLKAWEAEQFLLDEADCGLPV